MRLPSSTKVRSGLIHTCWSDAGSENAARASAWQACPRRRDAEAAHLRGRGVKGALDVSIRHLLCPDSHHACSQAEGHRVHHAEQNLAQEHGEAPARLANHVIILSLPFSLRACHGGGARGAHCGVASLEVSSCLLTLLQPLARHGSSNEAFASTRHSVRAARVVRARRARSSRTVLASGRHLAAAAMAPKAQSAFMMFSGAHRTEVKEALKTAGEACAMADVAKKVGERWRGLSEEEKKAREETRGRSVPSDSTAARQVWTDKAAAAKADAVAAAAVEAPEDGAAGTAGCVARSCGRCEAAHPSRQQRGGRRGGVCRPALAPAGAREAHRTPRRLREADERGRGEASGARDGASPRSALRPLSLDRSRRGRSLFAPGAHALLSLRRRRCSWRT